MQHRLMIVAGGPSFVVGALAFVAVFSFLGLNLYLGNYIGEFLGELCLGTFFVLSGMSLVAERRFPRWLGWTGATFGAVFLLGALRNAVPAVR